MSTQTNPDHHLSVSADRLAVARTRRQLIDTALSATGGESISDLGADDVDREQWHLIVHHANGRRARVSLNRRLGTVVVDDARLGTTRAA